MSEDLGHGCIELREKRSVNAAEQMEVGNCSDLKVTLGSALLYDVDPMGDEFSPSH
jgi:hypothetical protein